MGLTMHERHAVIRELARQFQASPRKERGRILDQVVALTGYHRSYAAFVLRHCGKPITKVLPGPRRVNFVPGHARAPGAQRRRRSRYERSGFLEALTFFWALSDGLCGKRLVEFVRQTLPVVERQRSLSVNDPEVRTMLLTVSPATADRLLAPARATTQLKGRSTTRPGTLLKHHIPVRTFADWDDHRPGFCEVDLVAHDGGVAVGEYMYTLTLTDVATGWTEVRAVQNKAQYHVFQALQEIRATVPFPLLGIDSDNGSEFINNELYRYCDKENITFTRSRAYRKNDNCFVEQKNYSVVRRVVGYYRYEAAHHRSLLVPLYDLLRLYVNFFQPVMKLSEKIRAGSRLTKRYDTPQTPYHRLLIHPQLHQDAKDELTRTYDRIHLVDLKRRLNALQAQLFHAALPPPQLPDRRRTPFPGTSHPWRATGLHACRPGTLPPPGRPKSTSSPHSTSQEDSR
jgi:hypothetical protein